MTALNDIPGWLIAYVAWGLLLAFVFAILFHELTSAATLSISGSATGNGSQVLQVSGSNLTAWWNGTAWHIEGAI